MNVLGSRYWRTACLASGLILPLTALAEADTLRQELGQCAAISEIPARVACYDALARPAQDLPRTRPPAATRAEEPGQRESKPESRGTREEALLSRVTSFKEVQPDKLQITLENGQVWQQTVGKAFLLRVNDTVRIAGSGWGRSFRLTIDGHPAFIQVSRLQ